MRLGRYILQAVIALFILTSCGPGYKTGKGKVKKIKNVYDITIIKKSKHQYELEKQRKKQQHKINNALWKKQMKNRYKE